MTQEKIVYQSPGNWLQVIETPRKFYYARRKNKNSVAVFLIRHNVKTGWEVLVRFQPLPIHNADLDNNQQLFACPVTGSLDNPGEPPDDCAKREVLEETGYEVTSTLLGSYYVGTQTDETVYMYWANVSGLRPNIPQNNGTYFEAISKNEWKPLHYLNECSYSACQIGYLKLCQLLGVSIHSISINQDK